MNGAQNHPASLRSIKKPSSLKEIFSKAKNLITSSKSRSYSLMDINGQPKRSSQKSLNIATVTETQSRRSSVIFVRSTSDMPLSERESVPRMMMDDCCGDDEVFEAPTSPTESKPTSSSFHLSRHRALKHRSFSLQEKSLTHILPGLLSKEKVADKQALDSLEFERKNSELQSADLWSSKAIVPKSTKSVSDECSVVPVLRAEALAVFTLNPFALTEKMVRWSTTNPFVEEPEILPLDPMDDDADSLVTDPGTSISRVGLKAYLLQLHQQVLEEAKNAQQHQSPAFEVQACNLADLA